MNSSICSDAVYAKNTPTATTIQEAMQPSETESCTIRIKGKVNGVEVDITITVEGTSCKDLIQQLTEK